MITPPDEVDAALAEEATPGLDLSAFIHARKVLFRCACFLGGDAWDSCNRATAAANELIAEATSQEEVDAIVRGMHAAAVALRKERTRR